MNILVTIRIILRSWMRNRLYFLISLLSLMTGLACTTLLIAFVINEHHIEDDNPNKERIVRLAQPGLMGMAQSNTYYAYLPNDEVLTSALPEVESILRPTHVEVKSIRHNGQEYDGRQLLSADSTLWKFFDYRPLQGDLKQTTVQPGQVAVSEDLARRIFGDNDPIGEYLECLMDGSKFRLKRDTTLTLQVGSVFRTRRRSLIETDLIANLPISYGTSVWLMAREHTDMTAFRRKVETTELPTLTGKGFYTTHSLRESYFDTTTVEMHPQVKHRTPLWLYAGMSAALLILAVGLFNYLNLSLSRLTNWVKGIRIQKLMGAGNGSIRMQLFTDALLMLLVAFGLALLLTGDLLPLFNRLYETELTMSSVLSARVMPWLLLIVVLFSLAPTVYTLRKVRRLQETTFRKDYTGKGKQKSMRMLVCLQFVFSFILLYAFIGVCGQIEMVKKAGRNYRHLYEVCVPESSYSMLIDEMASLPILDQTALSVDGGWSIGIPVQTESGETSYLLCGMVTCNKDYIRLLDMQVADSLATPSGRQAYVNETFVKTFGREGEGVLGKSLGEVSGEKAYQDYTIAGIVKDIRPLYELEQPVQPKFFLLEEQPTATCLSFRCADEAKRKQIERQLRTIWEKSLPAEEFRMVDVYQIVIDNNRKIFEFSHLILMYSLIALLLTCFGLFGISWYAVRQRTREIAIRKVHGATTTNILWLLNRPFFVQIGVAYLIAMPVAGWLMQHWLEQFAYRAEPGIGIFLLPLAIVTLVSCLTVSVHSFLAARINPIESLKTE